MNDSVREKIIRAFVAAILLSNLTRSEIQELADELSHGDVGKDIADVLRDTMLRAKRGKHGIESSNRESREFSLAYEMAARRRLSKKAIFDMMSEISPRISRSLYGTGGTTKDLISKFLAAASVNESAMLVSKLRGEPSDPYLKGITRRS